MLGLRLARRLSARWSVNLLVGDIDVAGGITVDDIAQWIEEKMELLHAENTKAGRQQMEVLVELQEFMDEGRK